MEDSTPVVPNSGFPLFSQFPAELRLNIWHHALRDATAGRSIHVEVNAQCDTAVHRCVEAAGRHRHCCISGACAEPGPGAGGESDSRHPGVLCMVHGHFASPCRSNPVSPQDDALRALGLACREAREVVLSRYATRLRVFADRMDPHSSSRFVRCDPAADLLVVSRVVMPKPRRASTEGTQTDPDKLPTVPPVDMDVFADFRAVLSSFQHVAFVYVMLNFGASCTSVHVGHKVYNHYFKRLLPFFESMREFYIWPKTRFAFPSVHEDPAVVRDLRDLDPSYDHPKLRHVAAVADNLWEHYQKQAGIQNDYPGDHDSLRLWIPRARRAVSVGCYAVESWLVKGQKEADTDDSDESVSSSNL